MADHLIFRGESTFYISGNVNWYNSRIWGTERPYAVTEHERDSVKLDSTEYIFQKDGAPLGDHIFLNQHLPKHWIGQSGDADDVFCSWPLRLLDLTLCDFFMGLCERQCVCASHTQNN
ncbi:uncharacterized protein TNCT_461201 [Trichonephila clavata]|uniref:Uncharacterized protein n=1 Tax=Trichonephila clavata TaxID=2740835 RepID=A0A8X6HZQ1_TRICU|nr:uncharacterized protein TNCT_461201 [Trichonephila clavata]